MTRTNAGQATDGSADATAPSCPGLLKTNSEVSAASPARGEPPERALLIALTRAVDIFANVAQGDPLEERVWKREVMPALGAAQDFLLAPPSPASPPVGAPAVPAPHEIDGIAATLERSASALENGGGVGHEIVRLRECASRLRALSRSRGAK